MEFAVVMEAIPKKILILLLNVSQEKEPNITDIKSKISVNMGL